MLQQLTCWGILLIGMLVIAQPGMGQEGTRQLIPIGDQLRSGQTVEITPLELDGSDHISWFLKLKSGQLQRLEMKLGDRASWQRIPADPHLGDDEWEFSRLMFIREKGQQLELRAIAPPDGRVEFHQYNPGRTSQSGGGHPVEPRIDCDCPPPDRWSREQWCSDCPPNANPTPDLNQHLVVHHSAGSNQSNDWPARVRSIWDFHVNGRGWADIGYHFLIDPEGRIYEGRSPYELGAHFCSTNTGTLGTCLLGTYTTVQPEIAAIESLRSLAAWQNCRDEIDPTATQTHAASGRELFGLCGHRDGCATECPGEQLYGRLPDLRNQILTRMDSCGDVGDFSIQLEGEPLAPYSFSLDWSSNRPIENPAILVVRKGLSSDTIYTEGGTSGNIQFYGDPGQDYLFQLKGTQAAEMGVSNEVRWEVPDWEPENERFWLYPNPAWKSPTLAWDHPYRGELNWRLIDAKGRIIREGRIKKDRTQFQWTLPLEGVLPGWYVFEMESGGEFRRLPFVVAGAG